MTRNTQRTTATLLLFLFVFCAFSGTAEARKTPWEKFKYPELGDVVMPEYERVELDNGMILYLAEDHEFPVIDLSATFRAAGIYEPSDKVGLADICGTVLRTGGTRNMTGDEMDEYLEARGMVLETFVGDTQGGCFLSAMKNDIDEGLSLMADILMYPVFDEDKIKLAKEQNTAGISRRNDDPMTIAQREVAKVIYGAEHPLARHPEYDTVNSITQQDLKDFHARFFHPDYTYLVVLGDFDTDTIVAQINEVFADWHKSGQPLPPDPEIPDFPRTVNVVDKTDLTQSTVIMSHKGILASDPNYAAIQVANRILGGGFASRLFNEVRSTRGMAYSVGSGAGTGFRFPGIFMAFTMTKSGTTQEASEVILDEIQKMIDEEVTDKELADAKDGILMADVFNYSSKRRVLDRAVFYEMNDYPQDFLQTYMESVRNLTRSDLKQATSAVWNPDKMSILAVGNYEEFDGDLTTFGPITQVDITIPEPTMELEVPDATPESLARGAELMKATRDAMGGSAISGMKAYSQKQTLTANIQGMEMAIKIEQTVDLPDRSFTHMVMGAFGSQDVVIAGDAGWAVSPMGAQDMTPDQLADAQGEIATDMVVVLKNLESLNCQALEPYDVEGVMCNPVHVTGAGDSYMIYFLNAETGLPWVIQSPGTAPMTGAPVTTKVFYNSYESVGGLNQPKTFTIKHDDTVFADGVLEEFQMNPAVDESLFVKP